MRAEQQRRRFLRRRVLRVNRAPACANLVSEDVSFRVIHPCVHPLYTPSGIPVTGVGAHYHRDHKGVWIGEGKVSGIDLFAEQPVRPNVSSTRRGTKTGCYVKH